MGRHETLDPDGRRTVPPFVRVNSIWFSRSDGGMSYLRQRPKIGSAGKVGIKLTPAQRDQLLATSLLPRALGHALHRAPVAGGKLELRVKRGELDALISAAVAVPAEKAGRERELDALIRYLEDLGDRFAEPV